MSSKELFTISPEQHGGAPPSPRCAGRNASLSRLPLRRARWARRAGLGGAGADCGAARARRRAARLHVAPGCLVRGLRRALQVRQRPRSRARCPALRRPVSLSLCSAARRAALGARRLTRGALAQGGARLGPVRRGARAHPAHQRRHGGPGAGVGCGRRGAGDAADRLRALQSPRTARAPAAPAPRLRLVTLVTAG